MANRNPRSQEYRDEMSKKLTGRKLSESHIKNLKGRVIPVHQREAVSRYMKNRTISDETKRKMSEARIGRFTGENNPAWKGGITTEGRKQRMKFRETVQKKVFERDGYTCQLCGQEGGKLQVDHIQSWADYAEGRFDINNCRTLCMDCHYAITFGKPMPQEVRAWGHNLSKVKI